MQGCSVALAMFHPQAPSPDPHGITGQLWGVNTPWRQARSPRHGYMLRPREPCGPSPGFSCIGFHRTVPGMGNRTRSRRQPSARNPSRPTLLPQVRALTAAPSAQPTPHRVTLRTTVAVPPGPLPTPRHPWRPRSIKSMSEHTKRTMPIAPLTVKNARFSRDRSLGRTSQCS